MTERTLAMIDLPRAGARGAPDLTADQNTNG